MMKSNITIILTAIIAVAIGLTAGYFIFGSDQVAEHSSAEANQHEEASVWTCSMHPQIRQPEPGDCPICGMDLIPLEETTSNDPLVLEMTPEAVKLANIQTTIVGKNRKSATKTIRLSGKIQADERLASSQVTHISGRIEQLLVSFTGASVKKGQKIAVLYAPELITAQQELLEALKLKQLNPELIKAARKKLRYWKISESTILQIEKEGTIQESFTLYADESGIVTNRRVAVGDYVQKGEPLFDLINLRSVWVLFDAYEEDLQDLSIGDQIVFTTPSLPEKEFKTTITFIDPLIDPKTRTASVRTEIKNSGQLFKPEMLAYGILKKAPAPPKGQLSVPKSAVLWTGKRSVVYVKVQDTQVPSFEFREIEMEERPGDYYQVISGLEAGEEVVTNGSFTIDAAAQLNNQASMINRNVLVKGSKPTSSLPDYSNSSPTTFKQQLFQLASAYLQLKDALVATNTTEAQLAANQVFSALQQVDMSQLEDTPHRYWMEQQKSILAHSEKIAAATEVEEQRKQFDFLSQALIHSVKVFGIGDETLYVQHCPMAFDNEGADWLSAQAEIRNPYFGDKMLKCGVVETTINKEFYNH